MAERVKRIWSHHDPHRRRQRRRNRPDRRHRVDDHPGPTRRRSDQPDRSERLRFTERPPRRHRSVCHGWHRSTPLPEQGRAHRGGARPNRATADRPGAGVATDRRLGSSNASSASSVRSSRPTGPAPRRPSSGSRCRQRYLHIPSSQHASDALPPPPGAGSNPPSAGRRPPGRSEPTSMSSRSPHSSRPRSTA